MSQPVEFAVLDFETTGISPKKHNRVVEVAVLRLDSNGAVLAEYDCLVNPERDPGPTHIHGITAGDLENAPCFSEIVGDVVAMLRGAVVVAHNARFDLRFLDAELERAGIVAPDFGFVCTLAASRKVEADLSSRKLIDCCEEAGVVLENAHTALADCQATARLFANYLGRARTLGLDVPLALQTGGDWTAGASLPEIPKSDKRLTRRDLENPHFIERSRLSQIVDRLLPAHLLGSTIAPYMELLGRVLEDRLVTEDEAEELMELALHWGLSREQTAEAHEVYLRSVIRAAYEDAHLSDDERFDINTVAGKVGISHAQTAVLMREEAKRAGKVTGAVDVGRASYDGKSVCFTGGCVSCVDGKRITRGQAESFADGAGMKVCSSVRRRLDFLVVADPRTLSGKAKKAREYGVRIVEEPIFWGWLGVAVD